MNPSRQKRVRTWFEWDPGAIPTPTIGVLRSGDQIEVWFKIQAKWSDPVIGLTIALSRPKPRGENDA